MTVRRLLVGLLVLALLSVLLIGIWDSSDDSRTTSLSPADATPPAGTTAEPQLEFPEAELQSGLIALCRNAARSSIENVPTQTWDQAIPTVVDRLSVSSSAEHLLAAALLQTDSASQIDLVKRAVSAGPADPLVLWSAVRICSDSRASPDCPLREWEQRLIAVDGQNSESWSHVAANRYAAGEVDAALEAMRFASTAAESSIYWTETIELIERGLLAAGDFAFPERANFAIGVAATELPGYSGITTMCREQSPESSEWAYLCLRYGELVEQQGKTEHPVAIARSVQRLALEAMGESERAAEVEERSQARTQEFRNSASRLNATAGRLLTQNATLFYSYLAAIRLEGETVALGRVTAEIERLLQQRPELACE